MGDREYGIDSDVIGNYAEEIKSVQELGVQIGIVIGGGNIYRGIENSTDGIDKVTGDHMGLLATVINALALQSALEHHGVFTRCQTAINMERDRRAVHPPPRDPPSGKRSPGDLCSGHGQSVFYD